MAKLSIIAESVRGTTGLMSMGDRSGRRNSLYYLYSMTNAEDGNPAESTDDPGVRWFNSYVERIENQPAKLPLRCPCCLCLTLEERGVYDICPVCFWEDDGQDDYDAGDIRGGPNGRLSLTEARKNYSAYGACDQKSIQHVRKPEPHELPIQA